MKKGKELLLFGIALLVFATASAVLELNAGTNLFFYLFMGFSVLGLLFSVIGIVFVFLEDKKTKPPVSKDNSKNPENEDRE